MAGSATKKRGKEGTRKKTLAPLVIVIVAAALVAAYLLLCQSVQGEEIWGEPIVNGVLIENMTYDEAEAAVQKAFEEEYSDKVITITFDGQEYKIAAYPLLEMDASEALDEIYRVGHDSWLASGAEWISLKLSGNGANDIDVAPTVTSDEAVAQAVAGTGILEYSGAVETTWEVSDTTLVIHKGRASKTADEAQLNALVKEALENGTYDQAIECPYTSGEVAAPDFEAVAAEVNRTAADATLDPANGYSVVAATTGVELDTAAAEAAYAAAEEGTDVSVAMNVTEPAISTEQLEANLFTTMLGSYTTYYSTGSGRATNIALAGSYCNGTVLLPGETFSYNGTVGERTTARGFKTAGAYMNGTTVQQVGGGICQVSSTIFAAVLQTNLEVVQRSNHSMTVSYLPRGMDATVSWPDLDLQFTNNRTYPVKLVVTAGGGAITVEIWGANEIDQTVQCVVNQTGSLTYETYRYYYDLSGNLINQELVCKSSYKPHS